MSRCIVLLIALHYFINRVALFINRVGLFINRVGLFINLVVTPEPPSDEDEFSSDEDALVAHLLGDESEMPGLTNKKLVTRKHERDNDLDVALNKNGSIHKCSTEEGRKKISQANIKHQVNAGKNAMMQKNADKGTKGDQCVELVRKIRNSKPGDELYQFRANIRLIGDTLEEGWEFIRNLGTPWDTSRRPTHRDMFELFGGPHGMNFTLTAKEVEAHTTLGSRARRYLKSSTFEFNETDATNKVSMSAKYNTLPRIRFEPTANRARMAIYKSQANKKSKKN